MHFLMKILKKHLQTTSVPFLLLAQPQAACLSVCLSIRSSHAGNASELITIDQANGLWFMKPTFIAQLTNFHSLAARETPSVGASYETGVGKNLIFNRYVGSYFYCCIPPKYCYMIQSMSFQRQLGLLLNTYMQVCPICSVCYTNLAK